MYSRIGDLPPFECLVRKEFLMGHQSGHGEYEPAIAFGGVSRKDMAFCVSVHLESGALWYELPLHAICTKPCEPWELPVHQMWDCLSDQWAAHRYEHLKHLDALVKLNIASPVAYFAGMEIAELKLSGLVAGGTNGVVEPKRTAAPLRGSYMFTVDFMNSFYADHPSEHKTLNFIELESGHIVAYPNNRCLFIDKTSTKLGEPPKYTRTDRHYFCETL